MFTGRVSVGHPVDIATGIVYSTYEDISIPGKVALTWERLYTTAILDMPLTPLGPGWTNRYFSTLKYDEDKKEFQFFAPEGYIEVFADPDGKIEQGETIRNLGTFQELYKREDRYIITQWGVETGEVERYVFKEGRKGEVWLLASIEDVTGQGLDMLRDLTGRLTGIQQRLEKRTLVIEYTVNNQVKAVSFLMPDNQRQVLARYEYHNHGILATAYDALGYADRYEYDDNSCMTREVAKDGGIFYFKYDEIGRCIKTSGLDRYDEKSLRYLDYNRMTEVTNSLGYMTRYQWNENGQVVCEIDPRGGTKRTEYDEYGRIISRTKPDGSITRYEYDEYGNRCKIMKPLDRISLITFNENHQPVVMTDPSGNVWLREYDQQGRWLAAVNPLGNKWVFDYDAQGNLIRINNPKSAFRNLTYSENGVLIETSDWDGNLTKFAVDHFGRVTQRTDCLNNVTTFRYDLLENLIGIVFPDNSQIFCQYDSGRNLTSVTNCNGNTIKFFFGTCGRLLERTDPLGDTVKYIWGTEPNRLEKVINEKGESHTFVYNEIDKIIQETCFDGRTLTFEYDIAGRCIATINGLGERISYEYDPLGRLIKKLLPDDTSASFEYDIHGNIISAANKSCEVKIERDLLGRIIKEYQDKCTIEYEYDAVGNTTHTKTSLGHEVYYEYDSRSYLSSLKTNGDHLMSFKHNNVGREIQRLLPGGIELKQEYDFNGQILEQLVSITEQQFSTSDQLNSDVKPIRPSEDTIIHRAYQYDKAGNLVSIDDNRCGISHYIYDPAERLIQAIREKTSEVFSYDKTGNIIKDGESEELQYGPGNRLLRQGNTKHIYDDNSRLVKKIEDSETGKFREWIYQWDGDDQLVSMTDPNGNKWEYIYDPFGRRISKKGPERTTYYIWDKNVIIHQLEHENLEATWIFDPRSFKPFAKIERDSIYPVITDHLGTPRELVDNQGKIVWSASYKAWGENDEISINKVDCPIRFPGQWADEESGLCYSWFRYYDPTNGHFLCSDPIGLNGGLNEFLYATNPINWIDPLGLNGCGDDDEEPVTIVISRSKYPEAAQHIDDNSPVTGRIDRPGASDRRRESLRGIETTPGMDRDEVPPAVLSTGGAGASVRHIPSSDNRGAGSSMGQQMRDLPNGTLVSIISGD